MRRLAGIGARSSSLVEVAADDAPLIDPDDAAGWVDAVRAFMADLTAAESRAASARARNIARFAWPRAAAECATIYASIAE